MLRVQVQSQAEAGPNHDLPLAGSQDILLTTQVDVITTSPQGPETPGEDLADIWHESKSGSSGEGAEERVVSQADLNRQTGGDDEARSHRIDRGKLRSLLNDVFTEAELRDFCLDQPAFRAVYDELKDTDRKGEILRRMLDHASRKGLAADLLAWAKTENPARYEQGVPYQEEG
jgi:hypothetical protein